MKSEYEKMLMGEEFLSYDPDFQAIFVPKRMEATKMCKAFNEKSSLNPMEAIEDMASLLDMKGNNFLFAPFICDFGNIEMGEGTFFNWNVSFQDVGKITFGKNCMIGPNCSFYTGTHPLDPVRRKKGIMVAKPINIGDNVFFGGAVKVQPGVIIGANTVIGTGSVVTKDIPAGVFAAGNPCRVIKEIDLSSLDAEMLINKEEA